MATTKEGWGRFAGWVLATSLAVALIDTAIAELVRLAHDADLATELETLDLVANFALFGWAGYRVARAWRAFRPGLEAAVLAGLLVGLVAVAYTLVRALEPLTYSDLVQLLAWNVLYAALGGVVGAGLGWRASSGPPR
ncbi:MAG TPA: hypothetical protein VKZ60_02125 [Chloroflexota bacterium]|nr:hypothetical protein [Chloroflexota bacterium]